MARFGKTITGVFMIVALHVNVFAAAPVIDSDILHSTSSFFAAATGDTTVSRASAGANPEIHLLMASNIDGSGEQQELEDSEGMQGVDGAPGAGSGQDNHLSCGGSGCVVSGSGRILACAGNTCSTHNLVGATPHPAWPAAIQAVLWPARQELRHVRATDARH